MAPAAQVAHPRQPEGIALLRAFHDRLTPVWSGPVVVLSDRKLYVRWLFQAIVASGRHPLMRITRARRFLPAGWATPRAVGQLVPGPGPAWRGRGVAFPREPERRLECTPLVLWAAEHRDGWYVVTDLAPQVASGAWHGLRSWIEPGFRHIKSAGWRRERARMTDPARAERLWLAVAVAECGVQSQAEQVAALFPTAPSGQCASSWPGHGPVAVAAGASRLRPGDVAPSGMAGHPARSHHSPVP